MKLSALRFKEGLTPIVAAAAILALFPVIGLPKNWLLYLFLFFIYLTLANMCNWLAGYCGLISLCQPALSSPLGIERGAALPSLCFNSWCLVGQDIPLLVRLSGG